MSSWFRTMLQEWGARGSEPDDAKDSAHPVVSALDFLRSHVLQAGVRLTLAEPRLPAERSAATGRDESVQVESELGFGKRRARLAAESGAPAERPIDLDSVREAVRSMRSRVPRGSAPFDHSAITAQAIACTGYGVTFVCRCKRTKSFPAAFFQGLPPTEPLAAIQQRLKCTRCGEKGAIATTIIAPLELAVAHSSGNAAPQ